MIDRREFLQRLSAMAAALSVTSLAEGESATAPPTRDRWGPLLPVRKLGRTGEWVTTLALGGNHIGPLEDEKDAQAICETAIAQGVRFIDTAYAYQGGESERRIGKHLVPKYREQLYLMSKTHARDGKTARKHLDESRKRLGVDTIDLYQVHTVETIGDVDKRFDQGVVDVLLEARAKGEIRHIGYTGHKRTEAHLQVLKRLKQRGIEFDACQMPVNVCDPHHDSFVMKVLPQLVERGYGVLAMKTMANGQFFGRIDGWAKQGRQTPKKLVPDALSVREVLHYVWSLPVSTLVSGMDSVAVLKENAGHARRFAGLSAADREALIDKAAFAAGPVMEFYKVLPP